MTSVRTPPSPTLKPSGDYYSLKRRNGTWPGHTANTVADKGDGRFKELLNCYPHGDGTELRRVPGWRPVLVPNWEIQMTEETLPWETNAPVTPYILPVYTRPSRFHAFATIRNRLVVIGEASLRRTPLVGHGVNGASRISRYRVTGPSGPIDVELLANGNTIQYFPRVNEWVYIEGIPTGLTDAAVLNNHIFRVLTASYSAVAPEGFTLTLDYVGSGAGTYQAVPLGAGTTGSLWSIRTNRPDWDSTAGTVTYDGDTRAADPYELSVWTSTTKPSIESPATLGSAGMLYSRVVSANRDFSQFTDTAANIAGYVSTGVLQGIMRAEACDVANTAVRRKQRRIDRRCNIDVAGDRVLAAVPGYGCVFQFPVVLPPDGGVTGNGVQGAAVGSSYDRPRALGVPKAVITGISSNVDNGMSVWTPDGTYRFRMAYRDDYTGDVGLQSEEFSVAVSGSATGNRKYIDFMVMHPSQVLSEAHATSLLIYASNVNATSLGFTRAIRITPYGANPSLIGAGSAPNGRQYIQLKNWDPASTDTIDFSQPPPSLEQMPMGCKAVRTVKGITIFGGSLGTSGQRKELQEGRLSASYVDHATESINPVTTEFFLRTLALNGDQWDGGWNVAGAALPPAYAGQKVFSREAFFDSDGLTTPATKSLDVTVVADKMTKGEGRSVTASLAELYKNFHRWKMLRYKFQKAVTYTAENKRAYLLLPRGKFWYSLAGKPGAVPAINQDHLDSVEENDIEAIGRLGDLAILCTRSQTFGQSFGNSPNGSRAFVLSNEHGCVAANSIVEFDGGCAWLGERGPVAINAGGRPRWVGQHLSEHFVGSAARYRRDSEGMMAYAWGAHDPDRGLVLWGLYTDRVSGVASVTVNGKTWDDAQQTDGYRSKFPANEILLWNYRTGDFGVWRPRWPIVWMSRIEFSDGIHRMAFLTYVDEAHAPGFQRSAIGSKLLAWEDAAQDMNFEPPVGVAFATAATASTTFALNASTYFNQAAASGPYHNGTCVEVGMAYAIIDSETQEVRSTGLIAGLTNNGSGETTSVTLDTAATWDVGDYIVVGLIDSTIATNDMNFGEVERPAALAKTALRYEVYSRAALSDYSESFAYPAPGDRPPLIVNLSAVDDSDAPHALSTTNQRVPDLAAHTHTKVIQSGRARGNELEYRVQIRSGQQWRLHDIELFTEIANR